MSRQRAEKEADQPAQPSSGAHPLPTVVGIGASAGGLAALRTFFDHVPEDSDVAWVVVVHLNPAHQSHLSELLQPHVRMPVRQVGESVALEQGNVYVIAPGVHLTAVDSHLRVTTMEETRRGRAPIDHFFRTLAATHDGRSVGVVLTGTGSDGALGIKSIKERDGLTIVQDPSDAEYDGMPQSAIATGAVDLVLPLAEIPDAVLRFVRTRPTVVVPSEGEAVDTAQRQLLQKVFAQVRARTGRDFTRYKPSTILRRIQRRMQLRHVEELDSYLGMLREDADEVRELADDLLINVTNFFRDAETWEQIATHVVPGLFEGKSPQDSVRVWSVGCATGEEVYSVAMLLLEEAGRREAPPQIQLFASDLHERSLERAREGFYPGDIEADVSPERLRRFFHKEDGGYRVRKEVRELVVFAPHNLLADPPFSRLDLIACRNLLIYLQRDAQQDVLELFHYALRPSGVLILGASETVEGSELFVTESKKHCIHRKRNVRPPEPRLPVFPLARAHPARVPRTTEPAGEPVGYREMHQQMAERHAPPSMLIAPDGRVVHVGRNAGRFLVHPEGELTASVFRLLREELRIELRAALHSARDQDGSAVSNAVPLQVDGGLRLVRMQVQLGGEPANEGFAFVIFEEHEPGPAERVLHAGDSADDARTTELEAELDVSRQRLQAIIEEYETSQEEMKASHEELQSANEELRSTLEELETSKEELQSMNEELQTVNQENRHKVEELAQLSSDLQNLLSSTEIATLFLDRDLRILRFTPQVSELFNVRPVDKGRPLSDLTHRLGYAELHADAATVLRRLVPVEREVQDERGRSYLTRVLPYRDAHDRIEGVVVTFMEISERVQAELRLRASEARLSFLLRVGDALRPLGEREQIFGTAVRLLGEQLGVDRVYWTEFVADEDAELVLRDYARPGLGSIAGRRDARPFRPARLALLAGGAHVVHDVAGSELPDATQDAFTRLGIHSFIAVGPVLEAGITGALTVASATPRQWTADEIAMVREVASRAAAAAERASAEQALRDSEERHRLIVEGAPDYAIIMMGPDGRIRSWSPGAEQVFGWTALEIEGELVDVTFRAEDRAQGEPQRERDTAAREGSAADVRWHVRKDGSRVFIEGVTRALHAKDGTVRGFLKIGQDVTQRRHTEAALRASEERFRTMANLVPDLLWQSEPDGSASWFNARWLDYTGQSMEQAAGYGWLHALHGEDRAAARAEWDTAVAAGREFHQEQRIRGANGEPRWFLLRSTPLRDETGAIVRWLGAATDIHEQRVARDELEARVAVRTAELAQANAALTEQIRERERAEESRREILRQLVSAEENERRRISRELHDSMGQLMTGLLLGLKAVDREGAPAAQVSRMEELEQLADRIARELQHMAVELRPPALDRLGLRAGVQDYVAEWSERYGIDADFHSSGLDGDRVQHEIEAALYRIVQEGLTNVLRHAAATQVSVVLERRRELLMLILEDNGRGFDVEETLAATPRRGERLGLRGMRERVALLDGELAIESSPGNGTTIFVRIPLREEARLEPDAT